MAPETHDEARRAGRMEAVVEALGEKVGGVETRLQTLERIAGELAGGLKLMKWAMAGIGALLVTRFIDIGLRLSQ